MKLPSLQTLFVDTISVLKRFPFECLFAIAGTIIANKWVYHFLENDFFIYTHLVMTANLGILISLSATLFAEGRSYTGVKKIVLKCLSASIPVALFFFIRENNHETYIRFFTLSLFFHLFISFAAFIGRNNTQGFWQFNKILFIRILTTNLYCTVLFCGIAGAISAVNFLLNFHINSYIYGKLVFWLIGIFNTFFFLAGVPDDLTLLTKIKEYPCGLKSFTQFVLLPLTLLYLVILLAYETKIIINWNLPKGMVSSLILGYAVFGILSLLLIYPLRNLEGNRWISSFTKFFYYLMIPLIALLFVAFYARASIYGITEQRYFLLLLAIWLTGISAYFILSKKQNIKVIPISLAIFTLLTIYGPLSAKSISIYSQTRILGQLFKKYDAFNNGKFSSLAKKQLSKRDNTHIDVTFEYLANHNDLTALQPYFSANLKQVNDSLKKGNNYDDYSKYLWLKDYLGVGRLNGKDWYHMDKIETKPRKMKLTKTSR